MAGGNVTNPVFVDGFIRPEFNADARLSGPPYEAFCEFQVRLRLVVSEKPAFPTVKTGAQIGCAATCVPWTDTNSVAAKMHRRGMLYL